MNRKTNRDPQRLRETLEQGVMLHADRVEGSFNLDDDDPVHVAIVMNVKGYGPHVGAMYVDQNRYHASPDTVLQEAFEILETWELDHYPEYFAELEQEYGDDASGVFTETFDDMVWTLSPQEFVEAIEGTKAERFIDIYED